MSEKFSRTTIALWVAVLVAGMALTPVFATGVAKGQENVTLTITVEDREGDPVGGVTLTGSWDDGERTVETAANGQALMDVPDGADVSIRVEPDEYVRNSDFDVTDAAQVSITIDVAKKGSIDLLVEREGTPINNAEVTLTQNSRIVAEGDTDADGEFDTGPIERGNYDLEVFKAGHLRYEVEIKVNGDVSWDVQLERDSVPVSFLVTDSHFDPTETVEGATVSVEGIGTVTTLGSGEATLQVPVNTEQQVSVTKDGYDTTTETLEVFESPKEQNLTISRTPDLTLTTGQDRILVGESVRVEVTDEYGVAVPDARVQVAGETRGRTDENGAIRVTIETAGELPITATADGLEAEVTVEGVEPADGETGDEAQTGTETAGPGFTAVIAIVALLAVAMLSRRR